MVSDIKQAIHKFLQHVERGIAKGLEIGNGVYPTFFAYEAVDYEPVTEPYKGPRTNAKGQSFVRVTSFRRVDLPYFLEL